MSGTPKNIRCAVYTRKSTEDGLELEFNSLDAQREAAEAYIASQKQEGWECLPTRYDDGGYSGGNIDRPAFKELMSDVEAGEIDCILVYKIDRLSRSLMDFSRIMETLDRQRVSLVSVTQQFNTTSSMGRLTLNILLSFAQFEREIISERTRDKMAAARRKGKWTGGRPVLGYDLVRTNGGGKLVLNKHEAQQVQGIFQLYLREGAMQPTLQVIRQREWKTKRFRTRKGTLTGGSDFDKATLWTLLNNVIYIGKVGYKGEVFDGEHDGIIDEELFAQVQNLLRRNRHSGGTYSRNKHGALLKGLVRCKSCGCGMTHHFTSRGNKRYRYYVCIRAQKQGWSTCPAPSMPARELEEFVIEQIRMIGKDTDLLKESLKAAQDRLQSDIDEMQQQCDDIQGHIRRLGREIGEIAPRAGLDEEATRELARLQNAIREQQEEADRIQSRMGKLQRRKLDPDEFAGALEAFDPLWNSLSPAEQENLIGLLIDRVEYDAATESLSISYHQTGIRTLVEEDTKCQKV